MLRIRGVEKKFGQKTAVSSLDLEVRNGEFLSILGPSGCGKTTLLRMIAGHETPDKGSLVLDDVDITHLEPHKRNVHTVFQRYALFPHMNVFDNVAFGLRCKKVDESEISKRVEEMLELANLKGQGLRNVTSLSGGEQQRVSLVRALASLPSLLLLDEPLGALDLKLRLQLQQELIAIQKRVKTTFVFVTHDQQEALNMSDRIVVMNKGLVEQLGTPNEIYEFPKTYFVASFVGGINQLEGEIRLDPNGRVVVLVPDVGSLFVDMNSAELKQGQKVYVCTRPEKLTLFSRKPSTVENSIEGVIKAQTYLGTHTQFEVTVKNGSILQVFQQNTQKLARKTFAVGDKVFLGWNANLSHVFDVLNGSSLSNGNTAAHHANPLPSSTSEVAQLKS